MCISFCELNPIFYFILLSFYFDIYTNYMPSVPIMQIIEYAYPFYDIAFTS